VLNNYHPLTTQWSGLSIGMFTPCNRRTVGLDEIVYGFPKGDMTFFLGHGVLGQREDSPNGD
jgi:hypothetical protein